MISENTNVIVAFLKKNDMFHWMWTLDGMAMAMPHVSKEFSISHREAFGALMVISREFYHSKNPEILAMKPDSVKEAERIIEDMETNPNSIHRQNYDLCDEPPEKKKRNWRFWREPMNDSC